MNWPMYEFQLEYEFESEWLRHMKHCVIHSRFSSYSYNSRSKICVPVTIFGNIETGLVNCFRVFPRLISCDYTVVSIDALILVVYQLALFYMLCTIALIQLIILSCKSKYDRTFHSVIIHCLLLMIVKNALTKRPFRKITTGFQYMKDIFLLL